MKVCITGIIGSGKSAVGHILKNKGKKFFSSDEINRDLMKNEEYKKILSENFDGILVNNEIDRTKLAEIIFNNAEKRQLLNSLSHPKITQKIKEILDNEKEVFVEIPLLIESGLAQQFDKIWFVSPDITQQAKIVAKRDNITINLAEKKIAIQSKNQGELISLATDIIHNDYNFNNLIITVEHLLQQME